MEFKAVGDGNSSCRWGRCSRKASSGVVGVSAMAGGVGSVRSAIGVSDVGSLTVVIRLVEGLSVVPSARARRVRLGAPNN